MTLQYLVLDFGGRQGRIDEASAEREASVAQLLRENQEVAFRVSASFYDLVTKQEALEVAKQTLKTATVTQEAAEAELANGRATLPDVLSARAVAAAQISCETRSL